MDQPIAGEVVRDEITLRELLADIKRARVMFLVLIGVLTLAGIIIGFMVPRYYEAKTVLLPVEEGEGTSQLGGLAELASRYSGIASLAGISLPGSGMKDEAIAVLKSELVTQKYIQQNNLLPILFSSMWNPVTRTWKTNEPRKVPTLWKAYRYFNGSIRSVVDDKNTGTIELTIRWKNPQMAAAWANGLVSLTNSYLRDKAIREAQLNVDYLDSLVSKSSVVQEQEVIYALMEQQIDKEMIAKDREEYALKVLDPAFAPEKPSSAGPMLLGLLGLTLGLFFGVVIVFVRRALRE